MAGIEANQVVQDPQCGRFTPSPAGENRFQIKWLVCLGVGPGVLVLSVGLGFGGQSRAVPQVTLGN